MIAVIGAGPIGGYTAYLLAKQGYKVEIYEEHAKVGFPVECTGILTKSIENFHDIFNKKDKYLVNTIELIRIHAPNGDYADIESKEYIVNRTAFDSTIVDMAKKAGVKVHPSHKFIDYVDGVVFLKDIKKNKIIKKKADILIGADGANSSVAKLLNPDFNLVKKNNYYSSPQARVKHVTEPKRFDVYLGSKYPNFFGWIVPEGKDIARVGVAGFNRVGKTFMHLFNELKIKKKDIIEYQGGMIPVFISYLSIAKVMGKGAIFLVGDAASQIKSSTGGGIVPGLKCASLLSEAITNKKDYEALVKKYVYDELLQHKMIRKILNAFSDKDYNLLIRLLKSRRVNKILSRYTRDESKKLIVAMILVEPRFLYFFKIAPILYRKKAE